MDPSRTSADACVLLPFSLLLVFVGCSKPISSGAASSSSSSATSGNSGAVVAEGDEKKGLVTSTANLSAHPEFVNWSRFPADTTVTRRRETRNSHGKVTVTTTLRLVKKDEQAVVIESRTIVAHEGAPVLENDAMEVSFPASFKVPDGMTLEQFQLPSLKAKRSSEETIEVLGKQIHAEVYEWNEVNETGPMTVRVWFSQEVPGRIVRQEMLTLGTETGSTEELTDWTTPTT